jgi:hypothetical protein
MNHCESKGALMSTPIILKCLALIPLIFALAEAVPHKVHDLKKQHAKQVFKTKKKIIKHHDPVRKIKRVEKKHHIKHRAYEGYRPARYYSYPAKPLVRYKRHHYVPLPYHRRPGYVIKRLPSLSLTIAVGGLVFYYHDHLFYRHYSHGYVVVAPPVGALIPTLPMGYVVIHRYGRYYYVYENSYYIWDDDVVAYRVVEAPYEDVVIDEDDDPDYVAGDIVTKLPNGAQAVTIDGKQYYRYKEFHFLPSVQDGEIVYIVVNIGRR